MQELLEKHGYEIVPFQEGADVMFNSALIYELAVLKMYAEPLLFAIDKDCQEYFRGKASAEIPGLFPSNAERWDQPEFHSA